MIQEMFLVKRFNRRIYPSVSAFIADMKAIMAQRDQMKPLMRGELIDTAFRERLMLAVTAVNGCGYCSYAHARQALAEGIDSGEVEALQDGVVENSPREEVPALLYAQHWAETAGKIDPAARERIIETYDEGTVKAIELALQTIQMGNLLGNTMDYVSCCGEYRGSCCPLLDDRLGTLDWSCSFGHSYGSDRSVLGAAAPQPINGRQIRACAGRSLGGITVRIRTSACCP
jgi:AhpD family alkylhydroperoxidase